MNPRSAASRSALLAGRAWPSASTAAALAAILLIAPALEVRAQGLNETVLSAMVQIVANRNGETLRGSGFIVSLDRDRSIAIVLTSSHVIEGAKFEVKFAADLSQSSLPTELIRLEAENRNGLAVFRVRGGVPPGATALELAGRSDAGPQPAQNLMLVGYPNTSETPLVRTRAFSGQDGALYLVDLGVGEGSSGGPVLLNGKVVGLVTATTAEQTYAVPFATIRTFLEGSRVALASGPGAPRVAEPSPPGGVSPTGAGVPGPAGVSGRPGDPGAAAASVAPGSDGSGIPVTSPFSALVTVTAKVKGMQVLANGFVVSLHRQRGASYVVTTGPLAEATDVFVTFAADRGRALPAEYAGKTTSSTGDELLVVFRVSSGVPESATLLELLEAVADAPRPVQLVARSGGAAPPQILERRYLGPDPTASFLLTIDGGAGPESLGGPVLFDGKAGGMLVRSAGARATALSAAEIRDLLSTMQLYGQPALPKR